jgi:hypothetical protein
MSSHTHQHRLSNLLPNYYPRLAGQVAVSAAKSCCHIIIC